ncbi:dTMP kinase [Couchioplanes caeruleus]|uniref:Uncharacterized protein n=2 Tax=Couchioplanes caeruleus TaxID=56438 RepID=A0A1K0GNZ5_9ACTN|nr:hypothetical protein [Couchioplanes caeruleus]OJF12820.1 hypothetical protein BG844_18570 [Couchioplanes caeruleus subsp. caeruleus]ROP30669.1 thymidylate kinase [Couchioplanes caeruleus]
MLVALEGIDAAGKTTIAPLLADRLREHGYGTYLHPKKDYEFGDDTVRERLSQLHRLIWGAGHQEPDHDPMGTQYHLFLHAAWFASAYRHRLGAWQADPGAVAVVDGWYHRSVAKAMIRDDLSRSWCQALFEPAGTPDAVVFLDVDPDLAWQRRAGRFTAAELGRWDGQHGVAYEAFRAYQSAVAEVLREFARDFGWIVVRPEPTCSPAHVLEMTLEPLLARIGRRSGSASRH